MLCIGGLCSAVGQRVGNGGVYAANFLRNRI